MTHDPKLVAHLRSALDEVATTPVAHAAGAARRPLPRPERTKWIALAAASLVVIGAIAAAVVFNRDDSPSITSGDTTTLPPSSGGNRPAFTLAAEGFTSKVHTVGLIAYDMTTVWRQTDGPGLLVAARGAHVTSDPVDGVTTLTDPTGTGWTMRVSAYDVDAGERDRLAASIVPGSGLPLVLPEPGWEMVASASLPGGTLAEQAILQYTNDTGTVDIAADGALESFTDLVSFPTVNKVTVAGHEGWKGVAADGTVLVVWLADDGRSTAMRISAPLGPRADELIASVVADNPTPGDPDPLTMPYFLAAADLAPGGVQTTSAGPLEGTLLMAWVRNNDMADGLLVMNGAPFDPAVPTTSSAETSSLVIDGSKLVFDSYGLTGAERDALVAQVIPGSGLPWLLPVDGWTMAAMVTPPDGDTRWQIFGGTVTLSVGPMVISDISLLTTARDVTTVTVAGQPGWKAALPDGNAVVVWRDPSSGQWASLTVPSALADRVDGLILAVATNISATPTITGDTLPAYGDGTDTAVGQLAPTVVGRGLDGNAVVIDAAATQEATLVVFVANWCPHCHNLLPNLQAWIADGTIRAHVVLVTTAESASQQSSADWLAELGWTGPVLIDGDNGDGVAGPVATAYGAIGWPYLVLINADGTVAARTAGELTQSDMTAFLAKAAN